MQPLKARSLQEAIDEVERELNIRIRCMPMWVSNGKVSKTDAQDRVDRLATALEFLRNPPGPGATLVTMPV
jgi:stage III sporulation protein SpoIIIAA